LSHRSAVDAFPTRFAVRVNLDNLGRISALTTATGAFSGISGTVAWSSLQNQTDD
jgi:hypothetical protein